MKAIIIALLSQQGPPKNPAEAATGLVFAVVVRCNHRTFDSIIFAQHSHFVCSCLTAKRHGSTSLSEQNKQASKRHVDKRNENCGYGVMELCVSDGSSKGRVGTFLNINSRRAKDKGLKFAFLDEGSEQAE